MACILAFYVLRPQTDEMTTKVFKKITLHEVIGIELVGCVHTVGNLKNSLGDELKVNEKYIAVYYNGKMLDNSINLLKLEASTWGDLEPIVPHRCVNGGQCEFSDRKVTLYFSVTSDSSEEENNELENSFEETLTEFETELGEKTSEDEKIAPSDKEQLFVITATYVLKSADQEVGITLISKKHLVKYVKERLASELKVKENRLSIFNQSQKLEDETDLLGLKFMYLSPDEDTLLTKQETVDSNMWCMEKAILSFSVEDEQTNTQQCVKKFE